MARKKTGAERPSGSSRSSSPKVLSGRSTGQSPFNSVEDQNSRLPAIAAVLANQIEETQNPAFRDVECARDHSEFPSKSQVPPSPTWGRDPTKYLSHDETGYHPMNTTQKALKAAPASSTTAGSSSSERNEPAIKKASRKSEQSSKISLKRSERTERSKFKAPAVGSEQPRGPPRFVWIALSTLIIATSICLVLFTNYYLTNAALKSSKRSKGSSDTVAAEAFRQELASSLILSLSESLHSRLAPGQAAGISLVRMLADRSVAAATRKDIAYITHVEDDIVVGRFSSFFLMNILHAVIHGCAFILDQEIQVDDTKPPSSDRILSLQRHINKGYEALVWLEINSLVMDDSDVFRNVLLSVPEAELVLADHRDRIDTGVFVLRSSEWSASFLQRWLGQCQKRQDEDCEDRALYLLMVQELEVSFPWQPRQGQEWLGCPKGCPNADQQQGGEKDAARNVDKARVCLERHMDCRGFGYNNRTHMGHFSVLPQSVRSFRMNQWFFDGMMPHATWGKENYFGEGDMVVRTRSLYKLLKFKRNLLDLRMHHAIRILMQGKE